MCQVPGELGDSGCGRVVPVFQGNSDRGDSCRFSHDQIELKACIARGQCLQELKVFIACLQPTLRVGSKELEKTAV